MADITAVVRTIAPPGTGNQDIITTDLGGVTPVGVLFLWNYATADGSFAHSCYGMGAATGVANRWALSSRSRDGVATTNCYRTSTITGCIQLISQGGASTLDGEADFVSFIANGVRINWSNAPAIQHHIIAIFFAGDIEAHANFHTVNVDPLDITDPGFQPDVIIGGSAGNDGLFNHAQFSLGIQDRATLTEGCWGYKNRNAIATTQIAGRADLEVSEVLLNDATLDWATRYDAFDASGMTAQINGLGGSGHKALYLALRFPNSEVWVGDLNSPTTTGDWSVTAPGFTPSTAIILSTYHEARASADTDNKAGSNGIGVFTADLEFSMSAQSEDGVGTTNEQSTSEAKAMALPNPDGTTGFVGSFSSFDANGWTLNFTDVDSTTRMWFGLAWRTTTATREQISWGEFEVPPIILAGRGQTSWTEFEIPDVLLDAQGQISFTDFIVPDIAGANGKAQLSFAEFETPDTISILITSLLVESPDSRRRGRISQAFVEFPAVSIPTHRVEVVAKDMNCDLLLEELDQHGIKPDINLRFPGFDSVDDTHNVTPITEKAIKFGELVDPGETWLDYSFRLSTEKVNTIKLVIANHDATKQTQEQQSEAQDDIDLIALRDFHDRWDTLTANERHEALCVVVRQILRLHGDSLGEDI